MNDLMWTGGSLPSAASRSDSAEQDASSTASSSLPPRFDERLRALGVKPSRQRRILGEMLFADRSGRHVTAEMLHEEAKGRGTPVALATVYNTLRHLTRAGLVRQIGIQGLRSFFDTNPTPHHHFLIDDEERLMDVPDSGFVVGRLPEPPAGYEIAGIDVLIHLNRKS